MTRHTTLIVALVSAVFTGATLAEEPTAVSAPTKALVSYEAALKKGDLKAAKDLTANFKTIPAEALDEYTAKYSEGAKAGKIAVTPVTGSAKILGDFAVITFSDGNKKRPDYDPAYLMKQNGEWKVFLKLTQWKSPMFELSAEQKKQLSELEEWYDAEEKRLYGR